MAKEILNQTRFWLCTRSTRQITIKRNSSDQHPPLLLII